MRKEAGLSQEEFAQKAGVGLPFLRSLEQEKPTLTTKNTNQVLQMFGARLGVVMESEINTNER